MNAKATKTQKGSKSSHKPNVVKAAHGAPEPKDAQAANPPAPDAPIAPESAQVSKPRGKRGKGDATLAELTESYLAHLESEDKSEGTRFSYSMDLKAAAAHFGEDTKLSTLTPAKVANFFESNLVTKKRNGKKKSAITVAKARRVFRMALTWAAERGWIEKAPIPADELEHARGVAQAKAKVRPVRAKKAVAPTAVEAEASSATPEPASGTPIE